MEASHKNKLPQEGTCCSAVGESLTEQSSVCPTYSGGDNERLRSQSDFYPSFKGALSQGGSRTGEVELLGSIPSTSEDPEMKEQACAKLHSDIQRKYGPQDLDGAEVLLRNAPTKKVVKRKQTRAQFVRPPTPVAEVASDTSESSCSQMSYASETSTRSSRTRTRKRTQAPGSRESIPIKEKFVKPLTLAKPLTSVGEQGADSEPTSPPTKQAKTRVTAKQDLPTPEMLAKTMHAQPTSELSTCIAGSLKAIQEVANESRNLKGSFVHSLKLAAVTVQAAVAELATRSAVEVNVERLETENAELKARLTNLSVQVEKLTAQVSLLSRQGDLVATSPMGPTLADAVPGPARSDELEAQFRRSIALEIGGMVDAKLAAMERRLPPEKPLRPPLAADLRNASSPVANEQSITDPSLVLITTGKKKRKGKGKAKAVASVVDLPIVSAASAQASQALRDEAITRTEKWSTVVGRKAKRDKTPQPSAKSDAPPATSAKGKTQQIKLPKVPATAAITVSIREGSCAKLGEIMSAVRQRIRLTEFGIDTVGQRRAADGGMVLTVAGTESSIKADNLASRMREVLAEFDVKISRPTKRAEARIMDLDDAITPEEVATAIAEVGGCSPEDVKVGEIRRPYASLGHVWVRGPLAAIKKLASDKHVRLGWTLARVQVLEARRMMCFRCLEPGHVRCQCTSAVDRSAQCYACGGAHKARECTSPIMRCLLCTDLGLPADHRLGGKNVIRSKAGLVCSSYSSKIDASTTGCRPFGGNGHFAFPAIKVLQCNLNHCRSAQNLFLHTIAEWSVALAVVAEPYGLRDHPRWFRDTVDSVAIYWTSGSDGSHCSLLDRGRGWVAVKWGPLAVVGCYVSPNISLAEFEEYLDAVANCIRYKCSPLPVLVLGDFNAHSRVWGNTRDTPRGHAVQDWAASLDLRLLNQGSVSTCVRWQGESIVDLSWATPSVARMVSEWRVAEEIVTLSDHRHIIFNVSLRPSGSPSRPVTSPPARRWALKRLNRDMLIAAANVAAWPEDVHSHGISPNPEEEAAWFRDGMTSICDASMPRVRCAQRPGAVYWWSEDIAQLRVLCLRSRRLYQRTRRRRQPRATDEEIVGTYRAYREATMELQHAIVDARSRSWRELLEGLDRDPWGKPYKLVMAKLRPWVPPITQTMDPDLLDRVVNTLFPVARENPLLLLSPSDWSDELGVTEGELDRAVRRMSARNTAPGPDGIPGRAWGLALASLGDRLRRLFNSCFRTGVFPSGWKEAGLVLLRKEGRDSESPSAYRPICLLDEISKLFERIIAERLVGHLSRVGPDLADCQYGFRQQRSTVDAILRVRSLSEQVVSRGGVALAVSLDIVNAFNSLPWDAIRAALVYHRVSPYLQCIVAAYLRDRHIRYVGRDGSIHRREITCGVPQGSVLGPLLWDLAYDVVLRVDLPVGVNIVCYADDTLVLAGGNTFNETIQLSELGVAKVVASIREMGLEIAPHKTEALWFHKLPRTREPPSSLVTVGDTQVRVGRYIKYLGLTLDGRWGFEEHFERLVPRVGRAVGALHRLLPNLGGPREEVRRLYAGVVRSMVLYGAPVWSNRLSGVRRCRTKINSLQRRMAIRIARGYRTVSFEAATLLARFPPLDILADMDSRVYNRIRAIRQSGNSVPGIALVRLRRQERRHALERWRERLQQPQFSRKRVVEAVLPHFEAWLKRGERISYRLTQVLTGHGCFGEYLNRIGREATANCQHCGSDLDSAQHTLEECPAWASERRVLVARIGRDLTLPVVVTAMLADTENWRVMAAFCEAVMVQKESAERDRERSDPARRRRRRGGNRLDA